MRLCEELKQWKLCLPNQPYMLPNMPKKRCRRRVRRKRKPPEPPEKVIVTVSDAGTRKVAVQRVVPKREKQDSRRLRTEEGEGEENGTEKNRSHNMSTQTTFHDLEFLLTDPRIQETRSRREMLPGEVIYTRNTAAQRTYRTGDTTLKVEHLSTDNIVVQIDTNTPARGRSDNGKVRGDGRENHENGRKDIECGKNEEKDEGKMNEEKDKRDKSNGKQTTFSNEAVEIITEKTESTTKVRPPSKVAKACGHRLPMVRVGGGWMEVPDYLRFHVPMHVHVENTKDGQEGNVIIRSQRPRSQLFSKKGESPSWTATLSRGTKGSASTTMRQRLV
ncbi:uncharacterized protein LOC132552809 [Ylistrum balloti]|uniref:uncharacterized protein LOC132552809 n=1 Tax=Ylistrum balloti TaxID=509963 RepID=UPI002905C11D|nr:uncharacterized protein LOC132552809 [Ylistrum balloti]